MLLTLPQFQRAAGLSPVMAQRWFEPFSKATAEFQINTPARLAAFNKNRIIEPSEIEFARRYTRNPEKMANYVYANQGGNGNEASGDGWRFRGRGLIQITLRNNYLLCGKALGLDLIANPDLLLEYLNAARSAAWYWKANGCNELADKGDFLAVTRRINPPAEGQADRVARLNVAKAAL